MEPITAVSRVYFFGRTKDEYLSLFALESLENLTALKVLDVASGPSSFCQQARAVGIDVTPVDPLYENDANVLHARGMEDIHEFKKQKDSGHWKPHYLQEGGMEIFLERKKEALGMYTHLACSLSYHLHD